MEILTPNSDWRMSLERKDNTCGYSRGNCVLIASEFNTSDFSRQAGVVASEVCGTAQWSSKKVERVLLLRQCNIDLVQLNFDIAQARTRKQYSPMSPAGYRRTQNASGEWPCIRCAAFKSVDDFYDYRKHKGGVSSYCKDCTRQCHREYGQTLRGNVLVLLGSAKKNSKLRGQIFALKLDDVLAMLRIQAGRCFYSGVPVQYKQRHTHWRMSLERVDNSIGYLKDNTVLIAIEFNTADHSRNTATTQVFGTAQWSRSKAAQVWGKYCQEDT
ncbi:unnamed protein product [Polarella glacialis]|uniref:Uncharacterized protein n=1 Tax=Polarella glacialis TaxID=89957 RepID=A0A813GZB6_POLGL|nr:unnamed protein product [Polarella glacialis]